VTTGPTEKQLKAAYKALSSAEELANWYKKFKPDFETLTFAATPYKAIADVADASVHRAHSHIWRDAEGRLKALLAGNVWKINRQGE
jgi:hypothetical protein